MCVCEEYIYTCIFFLYFLIGCVQYTNEKNIFEIIWENETEKRPK